jgi:hypothetical protein
VALLNGTKFNYVMLGSQNTSNTLDKIVLTTADQSTEVAQSSPPEITPQIGQSAFSPPPSEGTALAEAGANKSEEQKRADFMAAIERARQETAQGASERYSRIEQEAAHRTSDSTATASDSPNEQ